MLTVGTAIRSIRVPGHIIGRFSNEDEVNDFFPSPASEHSFDTAEEYIETLAKANESRNIETSTPDHFHPR